MTKKSLESIFKALNDAQTRYIVAGGVAVVAHGYVRLTVDLDLIFDLDESNILKGLAALKALGYQPKIPVPIEAFAKKETRLSWKNEKQMLVFQLWSDRHRDAPIDIFTDDVLDFAKAYQEAERFEADPGIFAPILAIPDLIYLKKIAARPKDLEDIAKLEFFLRERKK